MSVLGLGFAQNDGWQKVSSGIYESRVRTVYVHPASDAMVFSGTDKSIYKSDDYGRTFRPVAGPTGDIRGVNSIYAHPSRSNEIYAATDQGLFMSRDYGHNWQKIYSSADEEERACLDVVSLYNQIFVATLKGLLIKTSGTSGFKKVNGLPPGQTVYRLAQDGTYLYAATDSTVFRLKMGEGEIIEVFNRVSNEDNEEGGDPETGEPRIKPGIGDLYTAEGCGDAVFISSDHRIFFSRDRGQTWNILARLTVPGDVNALVAFKDSQNSHGTAAPAQGSGEDPAGGCRIFTGTDNGAFRYENRQWRPLYAGMETDKVNDLSADSHGNLYAATDRGIFFSPVEKTLSREENGDTAPAGDFDYGRIAGRFGEEPSIQVVQQMAVDYAEVHPDKIKNWREAAKKRAWLPKLTVGLDGDKNKTLSDSVWGSYSSGGQYYIGPDDKTFYDNFGWDVSVSWDLADLVWSSDQTSIDSRSKLMVELREDILDQVTRLYFERRRLQIERILTKADSQTLLDKTLRIQELTALIDALTGGGFSTGITGPR